MKTRTCLAVACAAAWAMSQGTSLAQPPPPRGEEGPDQLMAEGQQSRLGSELGLNTNQTSAIRKIMYETRKKMIQLRADQEAAREDIEFQMDSDTPDEKAVMDACEKLGQVNAEIARNRVRNQLEMSKILTPEQREKMKQLRERMKQRREFRRGEFGGEDGKGHEGKGRFQPGGNRPQRPGFGGPEGRPGAGGPPPDVGPAE